MSCSGVISAGLISRGKTPEAGRCPIKTEAVSDLIKQCHVRPGDLLGNLLPKAQAFALKDGTNFRVQGPMQVGLLGMKIAGPQGPSLEGPSSEIGDPGGPLGQQVEE